MANKKKWNSKFILPKKAQKLVNKVVVNNPKKIRTTKLVDFNLVILSKANPNVRVVNKI
jgi:hypothetical protein